MGVSYLVLRSMLLLGSVALGAAEPKPGELLPAPARVTVLDLQGLQAIRTRAGSCFDKQPLLAEQGRHRIEEEDGGFSGYWSKSPRDPLRLLALFPHLRMKPGFRIVAYQWLDDIGGYSVAYGLPEGAGWPEAGACLKTEMIPATEDIPAYKTTRPRPPKAILDLSTLIQPDGSPVSYAEAALFLQEVRELGAWWHGIGWGCEPFVGSLEEVHRRAERWKSEKEKQGPDPLKDWTRKEAIPDDLSPSVRLDASTAKVIWYTISERGLQRLNRWTFTFDPAGRLLDTQIQAVAESTQAIVF